MQDILNFQTVKKCECLVLCQCARRCPSVPAAAAPHHPNVNIISTLCLKHASFLRLLRAILEWEEGIIGKHIDRKYF